MPGLSLGRPGIWKTLWNLGLTVPGGPRLRATAKESAWGVGVKFKTFSLPLSRTPPPPPLALSELTESLRTCAVALKFFRGEKSFEPSHLHKCYKVKTEYCSMETGMSIYNSCAIHCNMNILSLRTSCTVGHESYFVGQTCLPSMYNHCNSPQMPGTSECPDLLPSPQPMHII